MAREDGFIPLRERVVPSEFPQRMPCPIALIGEAPGEDEAEKGRPFVGSSGKLLNAMLRQANIDRDHCFVGNVFSTKLEGNSLIREKNLRGETWDAFYQANLERLTGEILDAQPTVIIPLGATAFRACFGPGPIEAFRGNTTYGNGAFKRFKMVPTYHPAHVLRHWKSYNVVIGDLVRASREVEKGPQILYPQRELYIMPTIAEVEAYVERCVSTDLLSCDIETGWGQIRGISFAPSATEALYIPFVVLTTLDRSYWRSVEDELRAWKAVKAILESDVPKLGQNYGGYDAPWLLKRVGIETRNLCEDLRLLHHSLFPELQKSLSFMASAYSDQGAWKHWAKHGITKAQRGDKRDE
jgi:DNA polymerase